jgi:hypothetical protein
MVGFPPCDICAGYEKLADESINRPIRDKDYSRPSKTALIRGKTALLFWEFFILLFIWLFETKSTLKITANSIYWKAKLKGGGG